MENKDEYKEYLEEKTKEIKKDLWLEYERQEKWIGRHLKILLTVLVFSIGGSLYSYFQIQDYIQKQVQERTNKAVEDEIIKARQRISERINSEFETPRIQTLIEESAKKYTEERVKKYITKKVDNAVTPFSNQMKEIIKDANNQSIEMFTYNLTHLGVRGTDYFNELEKLKGKIKETIEDKARRKKLIKSVIEAQSDVLKEKIQDEAEELFHPSPNNTGEIKESIYFKAGAFMKNYGEKNKIELINFLKKNGCYNQDVENRINDLDKFLKENSQNLCPSAKKYSLPSTRR